MYGDRLGASGMHPGPPCLSHAPRSLHLGDKLLVTCARAHTTYYITKVDGWAWTPCVMAQGSGGVVVPAKRALISASDNTLW